MSTVTLAFVGPTAAGKSTIINALSETEVYPPNPHIPTSPLQLISYVLRTTVTTTEIGADSRDSAYPQMMRQIEATLCNPNTVILQCVPAVAMLRDPQLQDIAAIISRVDNKRERTILVVTKADAAAPELLEGLKATTIAPVMMRMGSKQTVLELAHRTIQLTSKLLSVDPVSRLSGLPQVVARHERIAKLPANSATTLFIDSLEKYHRLVKDISTSTRVPSEFPSSVTKTLLQQLNDVFDGFGDDILSRTAKFFSSEYTTEVEKTIHENRGTAMSGFLSQPAFLQMTHRQLAEWEPLCESTIRRCANCVADYQRHAVNISFAQQSDLAILLSDSLDGMVEVILRQSLHRVSEELMLARDSVSWNENFLSLVGQLKALGHYQRDLGSSRVDKKYVDALREDIVTAYGFHDEEMKRYVSMQTNEDKILHLGSAAVTEMELYVVSYLVIIRQRLIATVPMIARYHFLELLNRKMIDLLPTFFPTSETTQVPTADIAACSKAASRLAISVLRCMSAPQKARVPIAESTTDWIKWSSSIDTKCLSPAQTKKPSAVDNKSSSRVIPDTSVNDQKPPGPTTTSSSASPATASSTESSTITSPTSIPSGTASVATTEPTVRVPPKPPSRPSPWGHRNPSQPPQPPPRSDESHADDSKTPRRPTLLARVVGSLTTKQEGAE